MSKLTTNSDATTGRQEVERLIESLSDQILALQSIDDRSPEENERADREMLDLQRMRDDLVLNLSGGDAGFPRRRRT